MEVFASRKSKYVCSALNISQTQISILLERNLHPDHWVDGDRAPTVGGRRLALLPQDRFSTVHALEEAQLTARSGWELLFHGFEDKAQGTLDWQIIVSDETPA
jgi:hypothetical protein